ncbi:RCC1 and BTB domain-containing protein 1-like isoform X2 [Calliopsis andreniformis]|uniref:RCC1 and BTB domain-containing protein 1-like isoform X2 n=1 Tax=Calliopsis andreniformis TaxID=337506 RepID=UPI003FCE1977
MSLQDLQMWPVFSLLDPKFVSTIRLAAVYGQEALMVTKDEQVYILSPSQCNFLQKEKGKVYSWGNYRSESTIVDTQTMSPTIIKYDAEDECIIDIACGYSHSLALTNCGQVYAWGENSSGQVGGKISGPQYQPKKVSINNEVICISCTALSSVTVTDNGEVYSWGCNHSGQLGIGNIANQVNYPCKVESLTGVIIKKVVCGYAHTLALSDKGALYVWGANEFGQLGLGNKKENSYTPVQLKVPEMGKVLDVAASHYNHISVAMTQDNKVFIWGQCLNQSVRTPVLASQTCLDPVFALYATPRVMYRPLILHIEDRDENEDEGASLIDHLREAFDDSTTSDLVIQVDGKPIHVHKAILKIRSQYFRTLFEKHDTENDQSVIEHYQFSYNAYKAFLKYLYTAKIDESFEVVLELLHLANTYSESQLQNYCTQILKDLITVENVAPIYSAAFKSEAKELKERCFKFALKHITAVMQTPNFAKLDESVHKDFITKATEAGSFKT